MKGDRRAPFYLILEQSLVAALFFNNTILYFRQLYGILKKGGAPYDQSSSH